MGKLFYVFHFIVVLHDEIVETFCICTDWIEESGDLLDWVVASQDINYLLAFNVKIPAARVRLLLKYSVKSPNNLSSLGMMGKGV